MAQNRTNGGFVSNMYEILNAYKYFQILLHFAGNHKRRHEQEQITFTILLPSLPTLHRSYYPFQLFVFVFSQHKK